MSKVIPAKFHAGYFSKDDAPWLGRPAGIDSGQIKTLIENNQCSTTWEIANILKISKLAIEESLAPSLVLLIALLFGIHLSSGKKKQTFLSLFLHVIVYLNVTKMFCF